MVYFATIHGTASVNSSTFVSYIEQWASTNDTIVTTLYKVLNISIAGPGTTEGECCNEISVTTDSEVTTPELFQNTTQIECCNETTVAKLSTSEPFPNTTGVECCNESLITVAKEVTTSKSFLNTTLVEDNDHTLFIIIGGGTGGGVLSIIIVMFVVIAVIVTCRHRKRGKIR